MSPPPRPGEGEGIGQRLIGGRSRVVVGWKGYGTGGMFLAVGPLIGGSRRPVTVAGGGSVETGIAGGDRGNSRPSQEAVAVDGRGCRTRGKRVRPVDGAVLGAHGAVNIVAIAAAVAVAAVAGHIGLAGGAYRLA